MSGFGVDDVPSTKSAAKALARIAESRHVLLVLTREDDLTWKSVRNLPEVHALVPDQLNTYDVLCADDIVFTRGALEAFIAGPARGSPHGWCPVRARADGF